ncbi:MAG: helix-turn-helix domain-containing protein [Clostridia bacterium]
MAVDYSIIGSRIKKARLEAGLTQQEMAEKTNLSIAFISRVERGSSHINLKRLSEFCSILNVSEGYILNGVSDSDDKYLYEEFNDILKKCSPEKQKLIYKLSKMIAEDEY